MSKPDIHDAIFKEVESIKENAADYIQGVFPAQLVKRLDLDSLVMDNNSYIDEVLQKSFSDLVYTCRYGGKIEVKVALLFEHKSYIPDYPCIQLLKYMLMIWEQQIKRKEQVMPVIPVIFFHGKKKWNVKNMVHMFEGVDEYISSYIPYFDYILTDITTYSDKDIRERLFHREANQVLFSLMKHIYNGNKLPELLEDIFSKGEKYYEQEEGEKFLKSILIYIFNSTEIDSKMLINTLTNISLKGGEIAMTTAMKLREEGKLEGRHEGKLEGKREGKLEGKREGRKEEKIEMAKKMLERGFSGRDISDLTGLSFEEIQNLRGKS